jgi:hypothetical protein
MNRRKGARPYISLSVPESVVVRVHQRLENDEQSAAQARPSKNSRRPAVGFVQPSSVPNEFDDEAGLVIDEEWERKVERTAQQLRDHRRNRKS